MNQQEMDAGVAIVAGSGIVLRYHPLTLVIEPASNPESAASTATELVGALLSEQSFDFASVANALQGLVVAEQPIGVAAVVDVENPIIFLFDKAAAQGGSERHQSQGRSGWTTAYAASDQVTLIVGENLQNPSVQIWSRLTQGIVSGSGADVQLGIKPPTPSRSEAPANSAITDDAAEEAAALEDSQTSTGDKAGQAALATVGAAAMATQAADLDADVVQTDSDLVETDSDVVETDSDVVETDSDLVETDSDLVETDSDIEVLETEFATEAVDLDDTPRAPVSREELRRTIAAASLAAAGAAAIESDEATVESDEATVESDEATVESDEATVESDDATVESDETAIDVETSLQEPDTEPDTDPSPDAFDPDVTVTEVLDPAELGLAPPDEIDLVDAQAEPEPLPGPGVIAGPPPMPSPVAKASAEEPQIIAGPPPMPDEVIDVTSGPDTIIMPDPMTAAGPEPTDEDYPAPEVLSGPPPMPGGPGPRVRS